MATFDDGMTILNVSKLLLEPCHEGWVTVLQVGEATFYMKKHQDTGFFYSRLATTVNCSSPDELFECILDTDYYRTLSKAVADSRTLEMDGTTHYIWEMKYPFPMSNRLYIFSVKKFSLDYKGHNITGIELTDRDSGGIIENEGSVRVKDFHEIICACFEGPSTLKIIRQRYENPGIVFPAWCIQYSAKFMLPDTYQAFKNALMGYDDYKKKRHNDGPTEK